MTAPLNIKDSERYPEAIYTACAWLADGLDVDFWEDEENGKPVFVISGGITNGYSRRMSPGHCFDELTTLTS